MDAVIEAVKAAIAKELEEQYSKGYDNGYNTCDYKWRRHMDRMKSAMDSAPTKVAIQVKEPKPIEGITYLASEE